MIGTVDLTEWVIEGDQVLTVPESAGALPLGVEHGDRLVVRDAREYETWGDDRLIVGLVDDAATVRKAGELPEGARVVGVVVGLVRVFS